MRPTLLTLYCSLLDRMASEERQREKEQRIIQLVWNKYGDMRKNTAVPSSRLENKHLLSG